MPGIVVFAGSGCHTCNQVKSLLAHEGVAYELRNVDEDDAAYDQLLALGFRSVPVTVIGHVRIRGYDPDAIRHAIADLRRH